MTPLQRAIGYLGMSLVPIALAGLVVRRRYRVWWTFAAYLGAVLVLGGLQLISPARFHTPQFWQAKETIYAALRFAMALELGLRTFRAFPGALASARAAAFVVVLVTLSMVLAAPAGGGYQGFIGELQPRVLNGSIWLFTALAGLILWYRLPVDPLYKSVLLSYVPYSLVFTVLLSALSSAGWQRSIVLIYANQIAYVALLAHWSWAIWRVDEPGVAMALPRRPRELAPGAE